MKRFDSGRIQEKLIDRLERKERQKAYERDRFFKFKLPEIHRKLSQTLLMEKIIETDNPGAVSDLLMKGLKAALRASEFDFKYFIAPIRNITPRPNPLSLYITQYILEVIIDDPSVIDVYGTDLDIYKLINGVIMATNLKFERAEDEILKQLAKNRSLVPGSREYDVALEQLFYEKMGEAQK